MANITFRPSTGTTWVKIGQAASGPRWANVTDPGYGSNPQFWFMCLANAPYDGSPDNDNWGSVYDVPKSYCDATGVAITAPTMNTGIFGQDGTWISSILVLGNGVVNWNFNAAGGTYTHALLYTNTEFTGSNYRILAVGEFDTTVNLATSNVRINLDGKQLYKLNTNVRV